MRLFSLNARWSLALNWCNHHAATSAYYSQRSMTLRERGLLEYSGMLQQEAARHHHHMCEWREIYINEAGKNI